MIRIIKFCGFANNDHTLTQQTMARTQIRVSGYPLIGLNRLIVNMTLGCFPPAVIARAVTAVPHRSSPIPLALFRPGALFLLFLPFASLALICKISSFSPRNNTSTFQLLHSARCVLVAITECRCRKDVFHKQTCRLTRPEIDRSFD